MQSGQAVNKSGIIGMVFDFDDTLVPDSTTQLLKNKQVDLEDFWKGRFKHLVDGGWEPTLAYLKLLIDLARPGEKLAGLNNAELREFGGSISLFPGLPDFFARVREIVKDNLPYADVKFWVISGGLEPVVEGCTSICDELEGCWACRLAGEDDKSKSAIKYVKRAISFTEKTRYLFHINKGQYPRDVDRRPAMVNERVAYAERAIPLHNIIYVGDGLTDIPCFSVVLDGGGAPIGIDDKKRPPSAKQEIIRDILFAHRTFGLYSPDYTPDSDLCSAIRNAVGGICSSIVSRRALP